jgi:beta-galactosidase
MKNKIQLLLLSLIIIIIVLVNNKGSNCQTIPQTTQTTNRSFSINYEQDCFMKDGQKFRYIAGSIHSYRIPVELWRDRLNKMWASGLNAIQIYVFWNEHEPLKGVYNFEDQNDIFKFMDIAKEIGFLVILRPGPYVCGEHEYGGLPWWLLAKGTSNVLPRTNETNYMNAVNDWFNVFLPKITPYLYRNGGPIITVQIENEYGSYYACDMDYKNKLKDLFIKHLGAETIFFTTG